MLLPQRYLAFSNKIHFNGHDHFHVQSLGNKAGADSGKSGGQTIQYIVCELMVHCSETTKGGPHLFELIRSELFFSQIYIWFVLGFSTVGMHHSLARYVTETITRCRTHISGRSSRWIQKIYTTSVEGRKTCIGTTSLYWQREHDS